MEGILQSIRNLHTATAQNEIQPIEGKKKKKKIQKDCVEHLGKPQT